MGLSRRRVYELLWGTASSDRAAQLTSSALMWLITINVLASILETDAGLAADYGAWFVWIELVSVTFFCVEYGCRLWACVEETHYQDGWRGRLRWIRSPMALIDFLAILPFFLAPFAHVLDLRMLRALRLFRIFRLFKLGRYSDSFSLISRVWKRTRYDLATGSFVVMILVLISASLMWALEHDAQPVAFSSIPRALWWAIVTATTIGYGDVYPITPWGRTLGGIIAYVGICMFALPVGIIGAAFVDEIQERRHRINTKMAAAKFYVTTSHQSDKGLRCPHCHHSLDPDEILLQAKLNDQATENQEKTSETIETK